MSSLASAYSRFGLQLAVLSSGRLSMQPASQSAAPRQQRYADH